MWLLWRDDTLLCLVGYENLSCDEATELTLADFGILMGDDAADNDLNPAGILGASSKLLLLLLLFNKDALIWLARAEPEADVLRRSWWFPALKDTNKGDEGCDPRLGDEFDWLRSEGEAGRL